jgi:hypothetical protein
MDERAWNNAGSFLLALLPTGMFVVYYDHLQICRDRAIPSTVIVWRPDEDYYEVA